MKVEEIAVIEWEGSEFTLDRYPYPQLLMNVGFVIAEDDESITIAAHLRKPPHSALVKEHQMSCIRKSQITKIQRIPSVEKEKDDDLT